MATRRGFALVDTHNNTCVYTLSSSTSILCEYGQTDRSLYPRYACTLGVISEVYLRTDFVLVLTTILIFLAEPLGY